MDKRLDFGKEYASRFGVSNEINLRSDLCRLARFGANITDCHSCFIFLPGNLVEQCPPTVSRDRGSSSDRGPNAEKLVLCGHHSLCVDLKSNCSISAGEGLIGWVGKHKQPIHVSPFEHDSRTLGMYTQDLSLKSLIGIPIPLDSIEALAGTYDRSSNSSLHCGVIACDSKKSYAFSKLQGKLLEDLAQEVANTIRLNVTISRENEGQSSWHNFIHRASILVEALGKSSIEVLRMRLSVSDQLEATLGTHKAIEVTKQLHRLIFQVFPPHFPVFLLPNGDVVSVVDNMMTLFYENKIRAVCAHLSKNAAPISFSFFRSSFRSKAYRDWNIEGLIALSAQITNGSEPIRLLEEERYEYRRA